jgi:hypothetical protein
MDSHFHSGRLRKRYFELRICGPGIPFADCIRSEERERCGGDSGLERFDQKMVHEHATGKVGEASGSDGGVKVPHK